jgi:hypothetical protein
VFILKLGLLTCAFYAALTLALGTGVWFVIRTRGLMYFIPASKHLFWIVGLQLGIVFGILWIISFGAAWLLTYPSLKSFLQAVIR